MIIVPDCILQKEIENNLIIEDPVIYEEGKTRLRSRIIEHIAWLKSIEAEK